MSKDETLLEDFTPEFKLYLIAKFHEYGDSLTKVCRKHSVSPKAMKAILEEQAA